MTSKSEYVARTLANINQQAVAALTDRLADTAVENDRLRAENELLTAQINAIRTPQARPIDAP